MMRAWRACQIEKDAYRPSAAFKYRQQQVALNTEQILARNLEILHKERLTSLVVYNLVIQFSGQATALIAQPPRRLRFKQV